MATIAKLVTKGRVVRYEPHLGPREQKERTLYLLPQLVDWLREDVHDMEKKPHHQLSPYEQASSIFDAYSAGRPLTSDFEKAMPVKHGIWKFKTPALRIFGWFVAPSQFIAAKGCDIGTGHGRSVNEQIKLAQELRRQLPLNEPKYIVRERYELL